MPGWQIALIVMGVVFVDIVFVFGVVVPLIVKSSWGAVAQKFPAVEPRAGAVRRGFQSFKFGVVNLGGCVHVEVDEEFLHLRPAMLARWMGCKAMSVPWGEVRLQGKGWFGVRSAKIGMTKIAGPAWCLDLAEGGGAAAADGGAGAGDSGSRAEGRGGASR